MAKVIPIIPGGNVSGTSRISQSVGPAFADKTKFAAEVIYVPPAQVFHKEFDNVIDAHQWADSIEGQIRGAEQS